MNRVDDKYMHRSRRAETLQYIIVVTYYVHQIPLPILSAKNRHQNKIIIYAIKTLQSNLIL